MQNSVCGNGQHAETTLNRVTTNLETWKISSTHGFLWTWETWGILCNCRKIFLTNKIVPVQSNICVKHNAVLGFKWTKSREFRRWSQCVRDPVILLELMWNDAWHMKIIITFTFCCNNLWKRIVYGSGKSLENSSIFFSSFVVTVLKCCIVICRCSLASYHYYCICQFATHWSVISYIPIFSLSISNLCVIAAK